MVAPNETLTGKRDTPAPEQCKDCNIVLKVQVLKSAAGYYLGTFCDCGPNSRESEYYSKKEDAEKDLKIWEGSLFKHRPNARC